MEDEFSEENLYQEPISITKHTKLHSNYPILNILLMVNFLTEKCLYTIEAKEAMKQ